MLSSEGFDEIFICVGAEPLILPIPGMDGTQVMTAVDSYSKYSELGNEVVIIGGGEIGMETAIFLASMGKQITVLEMRKMLAMDSTPIHYYSMFKEAWEKYPNIKGITNAKVVRVEQDGVTYTGQDGISHKVSCENVVLAAGMKPRTAEAQSLFVPGVKCHLVGDCNKVGNIQKVNRNAFGLTSAI